MAAALPTPSQRRDFRLIVPLKEATERYRAATPSQSSVAKPSDKLTQSTPTQIETSDAPQLAVQSMVSIPAETEATHPDTQFATQLVPAQLATSNALQLPVWNPAEWQIFFPS